MANPVKHVRSDAGRSEFCPDERNDCVVRAIAVASGTPYLMALEYLQKRGRTKGHGFKTWLLCGYKYNGKMFWRSPRPHSSVGRYIVEHPNGSYILGVANHVFAVVDGVIHDMCSASSLIHCPVKQIYYFK